jgi:hypothetical protein
VDILSLQRYLGNHTVQRLLAQPTRGSTLVQRHSSFEHMLLGDATPTGLDRVVNEKLSKRQRRHTLEQERNRLRAWAENPRTIRMDDAPAWEVVPVRLKGSGLVLTYGEINTMPDYVSDPKRLDGMREEDLLPILQHMRKESYERIQAKIVELGGKKEKANFPGAMDMTKFEGMAEVFKPGLGEVFMLDRHTADWGAQEYTGVLSRNACHFAPYSWERWEALHREARDLAKQSYAVRRGINAPVAKAPRFPAATLRAGQLDTSAELARKALVNNGFADHFLQDSFASGHLINKTRIMAWFAKWLATGYSRAAGLEVFQHFLKALKERKLADAFFAQGQYRRQPRTAPSHVVGKPVDPQTAEEQSTQEERAAAAGVPMDLYGQYLAFMSSTLLQASSNTVHDYFNEMSLWVMDLNSQKYRVWGDDTLLTSGEGVWRAADTARLSREAIEELLKGNDNVTSIDAIRMRFPRYVQFVTNTVDQTLSLEDWHVDGGAFEKFCDATLFPKVWKKVLNWESKRLISSMSRDVKPGAEEDLFDPGATAEKRPNRLMFTDS